MSACGLVREIAEPLSIQKVAAVLIDSSAHSTGTAALFD